MSGLFFLDSSYKRQKLACVSKASFTCNKMSRDNDSDIRSGLEGFVNNPKFNSPNSLKN